MNRKLYFLSYIFLSLLLVVQITISIRSFITKDNIKPFIYPSSEVLQTTCTEPTGGCGDGYYFDYNICACTIDSTQTTCSPPDGGCPLNYHYNYTTCMCELDSGATCTEQSCPSLYYWDQTSCSCKISTTTCEPPPEGCPTGYTWDSAGCQCYYSAATCPTPIGGCATGYYWDSGSCSCKSSTTTCTEPSAGCGTDMYWDGSVCACVATSTTSTTDTTTVSTNTCTAPAAGCGTDYYWDSTSCSCVYYSTTSCYPPSSGCPDNYYWDSYYCTCKAYTTTACPTPTGGCSEGYYFDYGRCACISYTDTSCTPPSSGCPTGTFWDSYYCQCKTSSTYTSNCYPPSTGCPVNTYWDNYYCFCKEASTATNSCTAPVSGCGFNFFWDFATCSCKPNQTTYSSCIKPANGCGSSYYWDYATCSCRSTIQTSSCAPPANGCQDNHYWDNAYCTCKSYDQYYSHYSFDRLSNASTDILSCIKLKLSPYELDRLRYLIPTNSTEDSEIKNLGSKTAECWTTNLNGKTAGTATTNTPIDIENCLIKSLGVRIYREIFIGERKPTYEEHLVHQRCSNTITVKQVIYRKVDETFSQDTQDCLRSVLPSNTYTKIVSGGANVPFEYKDKVARCFGVNPQAFEEAKTYKVPDEIRSCLKDSLSEGRFNQLMSGASPTEEEKKLAYSCLDKLNKDQQKFLPLPVEQIPFIETNTEVVQLVKVQQENKKIKNKNLGGKVIFEGKAIPGSTVNIYIYSDPIVVTTKTDENGDWVYELEKPLTGEKHIAYAVTKDSSGNHVRSALFDFTVVAAEEDAVDSYINEASMADGERTKYIKVALLLLGVVGISAIIIYGLYFAKKIKGLKNELSENLEGNQDGNNEEQKHGFDSESTNSSEEAKP